MYIYINIYIQYIYISRRGPIDSLICRKKRKIRTETKITELYKFFFLSSFSHTERAECIKHM